MRLDRTLLRASRIRPAHPAHQRPKRPDQPRGAISLAATPALSVLAFNNTRNRSAKAGFTCNFSRLLSGFRQLVGGGNSGPFYRCQNALARCRPCALHATKDVTDQGLRLFAACCLPTRPTHRLCRPGCAECCALGRRSSRNAASSRTTPRNFGEFVRVFTRFHAFSGATT